MSQSTSIGNMIVRIDGLQDTADVTEWENNFIRNIVDTTKCGRDTVPLTSKQVEIIERIHNKHFAG